MIDEKRQELFNRAMEAWSGTFPPEGSDEASIHMLTTERIKDMVSGIIEFPEDDIAEWLSDHGYLIGMDKHGSDSNKVRWQIFYEEEDDYD